MVRDQVRPVAQSDTAALYGFSAGPESVLVELQLGPEFRLFILELFRVVMDSLLVGGKGGDQVGACLFEELRGLVVHEGAVLKSVYPQLQHGLHHLRGIHVGCRGASQFVRGVYDDGELLIVELPLQGSVVGGEEASRGHDLYEIRPILELLPYCVYEEVLSVPQHGLHVLEEP